MDAFLADVEAFGKLGITEIQTMPSGHPVDFMKKLGDSVLPRLGDL